MKMCEDLKYISIDFETVEKVYGEKILSLLKSVGITKICDPDIYFSGKYMPHLNTLWFKEYDSNVFTDEEKNFTDDPLIEGEVEFLRISDDVELIRVSSGDIVAFIEGNLMYSDITIVPFGYNYLTEVYGTDPIPDEYYRREHEVL